MNILFTSVGRRVELVKAFKKAGYKAEVRDKKLKFKIIGADAAKDAPALFFCDKKEQVCKIKDEKYIPSLLEICKRNAVDCLIPTIDTDLMILAQNKKSFEDIGAKVLISAPDKVKLCRDKRLTSDYFRSLGLKAPLTFDCAKNFESAFKEEKVKFPAFIKPMDGSSSIDAHRVNDAEELRFYADRIPSYVIQQLIAGTEYTVDIFCDYEGRPVYITPRVRIEVRAGEVLKTRIAQEDDIIKDMFVLIKDFKPCGPITVQLIKDENTGKNYYIEINPRFGGGAPLSIKAGANSPAAVIRMLKGKKLDYNHHAAADGAVYSRFDDSVCVK